MALKDDARSLALVAGPNADSIAEACAIYHAAQSRVKVLNAERDELRVNMGFAATVLHNAVIAANQKQKKFGPYTVHIGTNYDVYCNGCGTLAIQCICPGGPTAVTAVYKPRIWVHKA